MPPRAHPDRAAALLADLNPAQLEAVRHTTGPLLVLAGAGCGKTRVITRRAAYLASTVTVADRVLAITFTNKAADEMRERMAALGFAGSTTVGTFHSFCLRQLRIHQRTADLPGDFTVFDESDQRTVVRQAIEEAGLAVENWPPARMLALISRAKNDMLTSEQWQARTGDSMHRQVGRIYENYERLLAAQHGLDFDDLLLKLALLLRHNQELRERIAAQYTHVLVDEYQDTNAAQYEIARVLTAGHGNLCVTGDPDQSIYGWRGADISNILRFEEDFPQAHVVRLEQNYRSTGRILTAASTLIARNRKRKEKRLWTDNAEGRPIRVLEHDSAEAEARFIAEELRQRQAAGGRLGDVAVFYRINALSRVVEEALMSAGLPYQVARGTAFYSRKEIKDVLAYLRVMINPHDEVALLRIINTPARGLGDTTIARLIEHARTAGCTLLEAVLHADRVQTLKSAAQANVATFADTLRTLQPLVALRPRPALERVVELSGLQAALQVKARHDPEAAANVDELISAAATFQERMPEATVAEWLAYTSLLGDVDALASGTGAITLMTLHAAKGLEFPVCYIVGLEEGLLPWQGGSDRRDDDEEEERRLFFVGMTRAQHELNLCWARYRMLRGVASRRMQSPFLRELPAGEIAWETPETEDGSAGRFGRSRGGPAEEETEAWEVGTPVRHPTYGLGQIVRVMPNGAQTKVHCRFGDGTERVYVLRFAPLERADWHEIGED